MNLKNKELLTTDLNELENRLKELKSELMKINTQVAIGTMLKSPGHARLVKKTIAKINTIKSQRLKTGGEKIKG